MNRILVATDFSVRSDRAMRRASLLARKLKAILSLVHVIDADLPSRMVAEERAAASALLEESIRTLRENDRIEADWQVNVDDVHAGIMNAADELSADLIVIGPHRSRLRDVFVGTTAERVMRQSTRPLLVAVDAPTADHHRTLLALDFDEASKSAGRKALAMGVFDHTSVVVMHAFDAPAEHLLKRSFEAPTVIADYVEGEREAAATKLRGLLKELGLPPTAQTVVSITGTPARTILESAQKVGSDLIVLGTNQRKGFERMLIGSVTADVIRDAHRDILIIPVDAGN
jgi:nucleotide-binding universal stress UspA family protein